MTRKDYELIAAGINRSQMVKGLIKAAAKRDAALEAIRLVAIDLASSLAVENPRFDRARFMSACGFSV